uniref:Family with sequence similarity 117 member B n=1 Tax=Nothobranchius furzeri TaxID=105023 RepID=A0A8C6LIE0_NOTFU
VQLWPSQGTLAGSHLTGPWPQDDSQQQHVSYMRDKATQTPRAWADERRRGSHKRSASCGSTDQLKEIAKLRQQLQRSKRSSRHRRDKDRKSPFNGSHTIIQSQASIPKTILIPIPISKSSAPRFRNSVEGLNQEIERIIIRDTPEKEETIVPQDVPDGHRAPPPVPPQRSSSTRSIDTQTPSGGGLSSNHSNCSSHSEWCMCCCEKVKVSEETMPKALQEIPPFLCPDRNKVNFIPNSGSAFCLVSILKPLLPAPDLNFRPGVGLRSLSPSLVPLSTQPCLLEEPESF